MIYFRKNFLLFLFIVVFISNSWATIVQKMIDENYSEMIRPFVSKWYVGTLYMENNKLKIIYESDFGKYPTFMAYKISDDRIDIIIKSIPLNSIARGNETYTPTYYLLTLSLNDGVINYVCHFIENPFLIINGFTFNVGKINERYVNIRKKPTTRSEIHCVLYRNNNVTATSIGNDLFRVAQMLDFWLEIELDNERYWIYGYYVEFSKEIMLE
jgi:hypothetical protein